MILQIRDVSVIISDDRLYASMYLQGGLSCGHNSCIMQYQLQAAAVSEGCTISWHAVCTLKQPNIEILKGLSRAFCKSLMHCLYYEKKCEFGDIEALTQTIRHQSTRFRRNISYSSAAEEFVQALQHSFAPTGLLSVFAGLLDGERVTGGTPLGAITNLPDDGTGSVDFEVAVGDLFTLLGGDTGVGYLCTGAEEEVCLRVAAANVRGILVATHAIGCQRNVDSLVGQPVRTLM